MATFDETVKTFEAEMDRLGISYDHNLFMAVTKGLGPSIYSNDASRVFLLGQNRNGKSKN